MRLSILVGALIVPLGASSARAEVREVALEGTFTPGVSRAGAEPGGFVAASTSWNGARDRLTLDGTAELHLAGRLRLAIAIHDLDGSTGRPGAGLAMQWLDEAHHGIALSSYLLVKAEGFTEAAGEIEAVLALGRRVGSLHATMDLAYGQDPDGKERDGELTLALHGSLGASVLVGGIARGRDALGSGGDRGVQRDLFAGASGTVLVDRVALTALAGVSGIQLVGKAAAFGPAASLAIGTVF